MTAGWWTWKSSPTKKSVTTYQSKALAPKIDGAATEWLQIAERANVKLFQVERRGGCREAFGVNRRRATTSADLGDSSNY